MTPAEERLAYMQQLSVLLGRQPSTRETHSYGYSSATASGFNFLPLGFSF